MEVEETILEPPEGRKSRIPGGNIRIYLISGKIDLKKGKNLMKNRPKAEHLHGTRLFLFNSVRFRSGSFYSFQ